MDTRRQLQITCDDFGMHNTINEAIGDLLERFDPLCASLMAVGNAFDDAVARLKAMGRSRCGVHLALTSEYAALPTRSVTRAPSLVQSSGFFWPRVDQLRPVAVHSQIIDELSAQIDRVLDAGIEISHLDSHMFFWEKDQWGDESALAVARNLADSLEVPLRERNAHGSEFTHQHFIWESHPDRVARFEYYRQLFGRLPIGHNELLLHPGKSALALSEFTQAGERRIADYLFFLAEPWQALAKEHDIEVRVLR